MIGNCSLNGSKSLTAISRPLLAECACSAASLMVPNGPPVLVFTSYVPAECHLYNQKKKESQTHTRTGTRTYSIYTYNERLYVRDTEHEWSAVLLCDESFELPLAFLHGLLVILANSGVILRHLFSCFRNQKALLENNKN